MLRSNILIVATFLVKSEMLMIHKLVELVGGVAAKVRAESATCHLLMVCLPALSLQRPLDKEHKPRFTNSSIYILLG